MHVNVCINTKNWAVVASMQETKETAASTAKVSQTDLTLWVCNMHFEESCTF